MFTYATTNIWHICIICGCQALSTFKFDHLEKKNFNGRIHGLLPLLLPGYMLLFDDIAWCAQHCVQSRQVQRHTHWTTHFHIESFLLYVLLELLLYCAHTKTVLPILLLLPLHFKKSRKFNLSYDQQHGQQKIFNRASNFLEILQLEKFAYMISEKIIFSYFK